MPGQLSGLGSAFQYRFECTGDLTDISDAISYQQRAINLTPEAMQTCPAG